MRTNQVGQALNNNAVALPSDDYNGEFFNGPDPSAMEGQNLYSGKPKVYNMAYLQGAPHVIVESFYGQGVVVQYMITGVSYSWDWKDRNKAWSWAKDRKQHVNMLR